MSIRFIIIVVMVFGGVLLVIALISALMAQKGRPQPAQADPVPADPEKRQEVLKKLAAGELTKAEAEEQLNELGAPVPLSVPSPGSGARKGCLITLIAVLIVVSVPLILGVFAFLNHSQKSLFMM